MTTKTTRRIGEKVTLRSDLHKVFGDWYFSMNGRTGTITAIDADDGDGYPAYGVQFGRSEFRTVTEEMIRE